MERRSETKRSSKISIESESNRDVTCYVIEIISAETKIMILVKNRKDQVK